MLGVRVPQYAPNVGKSDDEIIVESGRTRPFVEVRHRSAAWSMGSSAGAARSAVSIRLLGQRKHIWSGVAASRHGLEDMKQQ